MKKIKILYNPFERYSENQLILTGIIGLLIGSALAYFFQARFDGVIDLHFSSNGSVLWEPFVDNIFVVSCGFIFLAIIGKVLYKKTRLIDIMATCLVARCPLYILPLLNINNITFESSEKLLVLIQDPHHPIPIDALVITILFGLISILFLIWMIALLYNGFKVSTNGKGRNLIVGFVLSLIMAEVLSKIIFYLYPY